jgi:hypothetical protein
MEIKICPMCNENNQAAAHSCKKCGYDLISVVSIKIPADETSNKNNYPVDENIEEQTAKSESLLSTFVYWFLLGFLGWFIIVSLILGIVLMMTEGMGPSGIIFVPCTLVPLLVTMLAIFLAFLLPIFRSGRVIIRKKGVPLGIITAYVINSVMNLILNIRTDPLAIVGSILGWPFYMVWLDNLFGF